MAEPAITNAPRIWLVIGDKPGDNAQVEIIAEALGLPFEIRRMLPKEQYVLGKPPFKASLYHLDLDHSDDLEPPWPDLILTIGRRAAMAALWVQQQSGGHSQIVLLGRPKRWMKRFSLIIAPSQYLMPANHRVLQLDLPLMRSNEAAIAKATEAWRAHLSSLPRPITALMVGGQTKPFRFDAGTASELLNAAKQAAGTGFLYITTSRRTPPAVIAALQHALPANARLYCWSADDRHNPYLALLGLADRFIVTGDSMSMMIEVARLGKPLAIFALPYQRGLGPWLQQQLVAESGASVFTKLLLRLGLLNNSRDLSAIHRQLYNKRLAVPLGHEFLPGGVMPDDELPEVVGRIEALIGQAGSTCPVCAGKGIYDFSSRDLMFDGATSYAYHRCTDCGLVYQQPLPAQQEIASFYPESYSVYSTPTRTGFSSQELLALKDSLGYAHLNTAKKHGMLQRLRPKTAVHDVVPYVPGGKVLDIGCGNGEYLLRLKSIGWQCQGVEFNDTAWAICREHGLDVFHGDLKAANFAADSFDFVTAHHLIEHTADPVELIGEMARVTKAGGTILIRTPNSKALGRRWFGVNWFANDVPRHLMLFCAESLAIVAEQHGLQLLKLRKPVKPKLVLKSLDYQLGNTGVPSKKRKLRKWLAKFYVPAAKLAGQGDELFALYRKP